MELYQLEYFSVLCKYRSYTKASEQLRVTQPAVSIAVKKLEDEFGGELIDRKSKTFTLTPMGEALKKRAETINNEVTYLHKELTAIAEKQQGVIRVAFPSEICPELFSAFLLSFVAKNPDIPVVVSKKAHESIVSDLLNQTIDIGLICKDSLDVSLGMRDYKKIELHACFPSGHRLSSHDALRPQMLKDERLILSKLKHSISDTVRSYLSYNNTEPRGLYYYEGDITTQDAVFLVENGFGLAFLEKDACTLNSLPLIPPLYVDLVVAWCVGRTITPGIVEQKKEIIDCILSL